MCGYWLNRTQFYHSDMLGLRRWKNFFCFVICTFKTEAFWLQLAASILLLISSWTLTKYSPYSPHKVKEKKKLFSYVIHEISVQINETSCICHDQACSQASWLPHCHTAIIFLTVIQTDAAQHHKVALGECENCQMDA